MGSSIIYWKRYNCIKKISLRPDRREISSLWIDFVTLLFLLVGFSTLAHPNSDDFSMGEARYSGIIMMLMGGYLLYQKIIINLYEEVEIDKGRFYYTKYIPMFKKGLAFTKIRLDIEDILKIEKLKVPPAQRDQRLKVPAYRIKVISKMGDFVIFNCYYRIREEGFVIKSEKNIASNKENEEDVGRLFKSLEESILQEKGRVIIGELEESSEEIFNKKTDIRYEYFLKKIVTEEVVFMDRHSNKIWGGRKAVYHSDKCKIDDIEEVDLYKFIVEYLIPKNFHRESRLMYNGIDSKEISWKELKEDINSIRLDGDTDYNTEKINHRIVKNKRKSEHNSISNAGVISGLREACTYQLFLFHLFYLIMIFGIIFMDFIFKKGILFICLLYTTKEYLEIFHVMDEFQVLDRGYLRYSRTLTLGLIRIPIKHMNIPVKDIERVEFKRGRDEKYYERNDGATEALKYSLILHCTSGKYTIFKLKAIKNLTGFFNFMDKNRLFINEVENYVRSIEKIIILNKEEDL